MKNSGSIKGSSLLLMAVFMAIMVITGSCSKSDTGTNNNGGNDGSKGPGPNEVFIENYSFNPSSLSVTVGTTVKWTNKDAVTHTVTSNTGAFSSGEIPGKGTFSFTFTTAGTYSYSCTPHPYMTGTVVVTQ